MPLCGAEPIVCPIFIAGGSGPAGVIIPGVEAGTTGEKGADGEEEIGLPLSALGKAPFRGTVGDFCPGKTGPEPGNTLPEVKGMSFRTFDGKGGTGSELSEVT